ncbi:MAG: hypothetical protein R3E88_09260 [Myxococcota bacterium]|nr:hypothetical protein [Myxococcales bacterium]
MTMPPSAARRRTARALALAVLVAFASAAPAAADTRAFTGRIVRVSGSTVTVDNRMGDELSFARTEATRVVGLKNGWDALAKGDWVSVAWKFVDKPAKAYEVRVLPPRDDD